MNWTKNDIAQAMGIEAFDCALPQLWLEDMAHQAEARLGVTSEKAYDELVSGVVWAYEEPCQVGGMPVAVTYAALHILVQMTWFPSHLDNPDNRAELAAGIERITRAYATLLQEGDR